MLSHTGITKHYKLLNSATIRLKSLFTPLTKLLVKTHLCHLEPQTKKEMRANGQRKKTARVWDPSYECLGPQPSWNFWKNAKKWRVRRTVRRLMSLDCTSFVYVQQQFPDHPNHRSTDQTLVWNMLVAKSSSSSSFSNIVANLKRP